MQKIIQYICIFILIFKYCVSAIWMDHFEKKEQNYAKWDDTIWTSVEKQLSPFQDKVTDCMIELGDLRKKQVEDFNVEPCLDDDVVLGEEFYIELMRPVCVSKGYLPKEIPTEELLQKQQNDDDQQHPTQKKTMKTVVNKDEKKKEVKKSAKKGSKNYNKKSEEEMKMKIIKQNFMKDIELIMASQSMERLQVQFSFRQKKLEIKLMTFFYIAYFIRKKKQAYKINESEVFELINIMIKIVRIFDGFKGKSFYSGQKKEQGQDSTQVSPTMILDLKMCIIGLKKFYNYSNKRVIINYPKLVYYTSYDRFFPTLDIRPYPSQIQFILAVRKALNEKAAIAHPTLIFYKTMIGSGKTSASLALSNLIHETKLVSQKNQKYQVLYSCLVGSVRVQVGRYAYNKSQKFALAAMEQSIQYGNLYYPRIINSFSCRNDRIVDLVISDLDCTFEMLQKESLTKFDEDLVKFEERQRGKKRNTPAVVNYGVMDRENILLFIDEPTAFCKSVDSPATKKLFDILANYPPKLIVMASATMPDFTQMKNTIRLIGQRNPNLQVFQVESKQFYIGCQYCSFKGEVIFPHTGIKTREQLCHIISLLKKNPFLMRLYTGPSLFFLLKKCEEAGLKNLPKIDEMPQIKQDDIIIATFKVLDILKAQKDSIIERVCRLETEETNLEYKMEEKSDSDDDIFGDEGEKTQKDNKIDKENSYINFKAMLRKDAYKFLGGCLIATENPLEFAEKLFESWVKKIPAVKRIVEKYQRDAEILQKQIASIEDNKEMNEQNKLKLISKLENEKQATIKFPDAKRINTIDHYNKYCMNKQSTHNSMLIKPVPLESVSEELLEVADDFVIKLLFCGVALYMESGLSSKYLDKVEELASQNYLAYIITDQSLCYGTNFPISNVILCDNLAVKLSMNQMFQLIGRAGRVGQSWTARAFLEAEGLKKLNHYIHSHDQEVSLQASIFEQLAQNHLNNPRLTFRGSKSTIRHQNNDQGNKIIEIEIKKKEGRHLIRKICLVPFNKNKRVFSKKLPYKTFNSYEFASSNLLYEDIPTVLNSNEKPIIDVEGYYKNESQFISSTINNAVSRILSTEFQQKIKLNQINKFQPKIYEQFFCEQTNTFAVLFECSEQKQVEIGEYSFREFVPNQLKLNSDMILYKIQKLIELSAKVVPKIQRDPYSVLAEDVNEIKTLHKDLIENPGANFYQEAFNYYFSAAKAEYDGVTKHISDKSLIQCKDESVVALNVNRIRDLKRLYDPLFHVEWIVRPIWGNIVSEIEK